MENSKFDDKKLEKLSDEELLMYAAYAECSSSHPISLSLKKAYAKEIDISKVTE